MIVVNEIERDEPTHTYWETGTGLRCVGFTELMRAMGYIKGYGTEADRKRGKNVHLAVHYFEKGQIGTGPGLEASDLSPRIRPYFESYLGLFETIKPEILHTEVFVFDRLFRVVAQLDSIWKVDGILTAIDYKSGAVSDWVKYQTGTHINGLELPKGTPFRRWGVELRDDGKPAKLTEFDDPTDLIKVRMFASLFYTMVNDGQIKWPMTRTAFEKQRREGYGSTDLFTSSSATEQDARDGEAAGSGDGAAGYLQAAF